MILTQKSVGLYNKLLSPSLQCSCKYIFRQSMNKMTMHRVHSSEDDGWMDDNSISKKHYYQLRNRINTTLFRENITNLHSLLW